MYRCSITDKTITSLIIIMSAKARYNSENNLSIKN